MDPLGQQRISTSGYAMLAQRLMDLSWQTNTKVAAFLEGGYNIQSLADSALATMRVLTRMEPRRALMFMSLILILVLRKEAILLRKMKCRSKLMSAF